MNRAAPPPGIVIHSEPDAVAMRKAGRLAAEILDRITPHVIPGVTTDALNDLCHQWTMEADAIPAPLNYRGFPKSICTSVNHVVCHGIPGNKKLRSGDIINIDVTVIVDAFHGDTSRMFIVGSPKDAGIKACKLVQVTYDAMMLGIEAVRPGATLGDIGHAIQSYAEMHRFSVVRDFCGHGLGRIFHMPPNILHFGEPGKGLKLEPGMFFTIEPMINVGRPEVRLLDDGWTAITRDRSLSAQFEHSLAVTDDGFEIFTLSPAGHRAPPYV